MVAITAELHIPNQDNVEHVLTCPRCEGIHLHHDAASQSRGGVAMSLWCENCGDGLTLTFAQHEGCTYVRWAVRPSRRSSGEQPSC